MGVGDADLGLVETFAQDLGAEPAIGLELAQVVEEAAQGGVGRGAGAIHGGLGGGGGALYPDRLSAEYLAALSNDFGNRT